MKLAKVIDPRRWRRFFDARTRLREINRADDELDRCLSLAGTLCADPDAPYLIADGMWRNPNHFFRVRLFVEALRTLGHRPRLLGILRRRTDWRERRALERIGFDEFVFVEEDEQYQAEQFHDEAKRLLSGARTHRDILELKLPEKLPAYILYDTVLKHATDPQPVMNHPLWVVCMAEMLRNHAIYRREFDGRRVMHVVLSHPWKSEWATLAWVALSRKIPVAHLTGFCDGLRIRRFRTTADYVTPVEHLPFATFERLPAKVREFLVAEGEATLQRRSSGRSSDLNIRYAFDPRNRIADREAARAVLSGQTTRPVVVIYSHVWFDFPHTFAMRNFTDFRDWMEMTLTEIRAIDDVIWLLKPHPTEEWYGGFKLADLISDLPPHVRLLPTHTDSQTAVTAADTIVTVHGTVGLEAAAAGVPVILADRSYFSDWGVAHVAEDRSDYARLLRSAGKFQPLDAAGRERARACFALALGEPPPEMGAMKMSCDSSGVPLFGEISSRFGAERAVREAEVQRIAKFLDQSEIDSFAASQLVDLAGRIASAPQRRKAIEA